MATTEILLCSEIFLRDTTSISDNIAGKYIQSSIREAQNIAFRGIVGDALLGKLKSLVRDREIDLPENAAYKDLLTRAQYFIAYGAVVELAVKVTFKIANAGVVRTPDEKVEVADHLDMTQVQTYYQTKADAACLDLQNYIWNNRAAFPELGECDCRRIHANLYSAASCGIFLGGARGKGGPYTCD